MPETKLDKRLTDHSDRLDKIEGAILAFRTFSITNETNMTHLTKIVCGNGTPGLDEQARINRNLIDNNGRDINDLRSEVKSLIGQFQPVFIFYKVGVWFGGILGASVIALIWSIITHKVTLGIP